MTEMEMIRLKSKLNVELKTLTDAVTQYQQEFNDFISTKKSQLDQLGKASRAEKKDKIEAMYKEDLYNLDKNIKDIESQIEQVTITDEDDSDASLTELKDKREYLNQTAMKIGELLETLLDVSNQYYVDLAYTNKKFTDKKFKKELQRLDMYIRDIMKYKSRDIIPMKIYGLIESFVSTNIAVYAAGVFVGPIAALAFPCYLWRAFKRARILHAHSQRYHMLMQTAITLKDKTADEIKNVLEGLVLTKRETLEDKLIELQDELKELIEAMKDRIDDISFDEAEALDVLDKRQEEISADLEKAKRRKAEVEEQLNEVTSALNAVLKAKMDAAALERDPYINPANIKREVVFPGKFLFDVDKGKNIFTAIHPGLYVYSKREVAQDFIRAFVFQMRNYMEFGAININLLDLLMATFVADLQIMKIDNDGKLLDVDMMFDFSSEDQKARIDIAHDILLRRRISVLQVAPDIHQYNIIQHDTKSAPLPYEFIIYFAESAINLSEKLVHMFKIGGQFGVILMLFVDKSHLSVDNVKMYERYVGTIFEPTKTGCSAHPANIFRENFESAHAKG